MIQVCLLLIGFSIIDLLYADLRFVDAIHVTIKYGEKYLAFDSISRNAQCSDLMPLLQLRLGSKIPRNARLMVNGRFLIMHETIEEVCSFQILPLTTRALFEFMLVQSGRFDWPFYY